MLLVVAHEAHLGLEIFPPLDIPELPDVSTSLPSLTPIPSLDNLSSLSERTKATLDGHQVRVLVSQQPPHERSAGVGVFLLLVADRVEGLGVVTTHGPVADAGT